MHKYLVLFLLMLLSFTLMAENVTNVRVRQEGKSIVVTYDLSKSSVVRLLMTSSTSYQYTELKAVSGNVGKGVLAGKGREIVWKPLEEREEFVAKNVRFKVEATSSYDYYTQNAKIKTLVMGQAAYTITPQFSYGGMLGQMYKGIGWFVSGRSNFHFSAPTQYSCNSYGYIGDERPFYTGNSSISHYTINAGFMMNFLEWSKKNKFNTFGMYIGGGYGKRELQWETTDGLWVKYAPTSHNGFAGNVGLFGSLCGVTLSAGVSTINFKYMEIEAGVGLMF